MGRKLVLLFGAGVWFGCTPSVDFGGTRYRCADGVSCPGGFVCLAGVCERPLPVPVDAAAMGDAPIVSDGSMNDGPPSEGSVPVPVPVPDAGICKVSALKDNFLDAPRAAIWTPLVVAAGSTAMETGGVLVLSPAKKLTSRSYTAYESTSAYDLTESSLHAQVPQMVSTSAFAYAYLSATVDTANRAMILQERDRLYFRVTVAGGDVKNVQVAYSLTNHKWWRLREAGGMLYAEVSADGSTWSELGSMASPSFLSEIKVRLLAGTTNYDPTPGAAHFDNVNTLGADGPAGCP